MGFNVAIDGPAGAGKSTIARLAAARLGFLYVDTGAMYRAIALYLLEQGVSPEDEMAASSRCTEANVRIQYMDGEQQVLLNGVNVNGRIREEAISSATSKVSAYPMVREHLLSLQRQLAAEHDVLMDGRDIGTCILPDAQVKIFLTASAEVRARRRLKEYTEKGEQVGFDEVLKDIIARDERDMHRAVAPLVQAEDAVLLDTSDMTVEESVAAVISLVRKVQEKR